MTLPPRPAAFVLASTHHGTMIINRNDYNSTPTGIHYGVGWQLLNHSAFDPTEISLTLDLLKSRRSHFGDGVVALDCGANIGVHVIEWAKLMQPWGTVTAFEAQERIFYALAGNLALNNCLNARAVWSAIGENEGIIGVPQPDYNHPASFGSLELRPNDRTEFIGQTIQYDQPTLIQTKMISIDSLNLTRLDFIKIDIEGMEIEALRGGTQTLSTYKPIILIEWVKSNITELVEFLKAMNYNLFKAGYNILAIHATDPTFKTFIKPNSQRTISLMDTTERPVFLIAPLSHIGIALGAEIAQRHRNVIAAIDDTSSISHIHGYPRWSSTQFLQQAKQYTDAIAIDFSVSPKGELWASQLCEQANIEICDWALYSSYIETN